TCRVLASPPLWPLSLHDALPISRKGSCWRQGWIVGGSASPPRGCASSSPASSRTSASSRDSLQRPARAAAGYPTASARPTPARRSEEHTSELQSRENLVCRLLLE